MDAAATRVTSDAGSFGLRRRRAYGPLWVAGELGPTLWQAEHEPPRTTDHTLRTAPACRATVAALLVLSTLPAAAGAQDLDTVEQQVDELERELSDTTSAYEDVWAAVSDAEAELERLERQTTELETRYATVRAVLSARARSVYKRGSDTALTLMLSASGPQGAIERASMMATLTSRDVSQVEQASSLRTQLDQSRVLLADRSGELVLLRGQLGEQQTRLEDDLGQAQVVLAGLQEKEARKRTIQRGVQDGVYACIFDRPFTFRDTWGAPRSGGRRHKGTDVYSTFDAPVYAFTSGTIQRIPNSGLGGLGLYLWGDDGNMFYYAHLNRIAAGIGVGNRVDAGDLVAYNGASGNARGGPPHVHYQLHPGGGAPVNPYPWLAAACY